MLRKLSRNRGALRREQILFLVILSIKARRIRPKNQLKGRISAGRDRGNQAPMGPGENLPARIPTIRKKAVVNSARKTITTFKTPGARTRPFKKELKSSARTIIGPNLILPFRHLIHPNALRRLKDPNPQIREGAP